MKSSSLPFWEHTKKEHDSIESCVQNRKGSYQGLTKEALSTDVQDLRTIFESSHIQGTFVDLGCGTGESVLLYGEMFPDRRAIGIEFEVARLKSVEAFLKPNTTFIHADLLNCPIPEGDTFFLYFPTGPVLDRILTELYDSRRDFTLIIIESHGDLIPRVNQENWLDEVEEIPLQSPRHYPRAKIFKRLHCEREKSLLPFTLTFKQQFVLMYDGWVGETYGMEWAGDDRFELETPPRTIYWKDVKKLMILEDFPRNVQKALMLRRDGELSFRLSSRTLNGFIRKIILNPSFQVEISNGEKVEWSEILTIDKDSQLCYDSSQFF